MQNIFIPSNAKATHPITGNRKWLEIISEDTIEYSNTASFVDDMTGATLRGFFVDGSLDSLRLEGMATTLYHLFEDSLKFFRYAEISDTDKIIIFKIRILISSFLNLVIIL